MLSAHVVRDQRHHRSAINDGEVDSSETKGRRPMTPGVIPDCWTPEKAPIHHIPIRVVKLLLIPITIENYFYYIGQSAPPPAI